MERENAQLHPLPFNGRRLAISVKPELVTRYYIPGGERGLEEFTKRSANVRVEVYRKARARAGVVSLGSLVFDWKTGECVSFRDLFSLKKGEFEQMQETALTHPVVMDALAPNALISKEEVPR